METLTMETYDHPAAVARGIAFLDENGPEGWRGLVDLETLDLGHEGNCVLGQLYGLFDTGLDMLAINLQTSIELGFGIDEPWGSPHWEALTDAWMSALQD